MSPITREKLIIAVCVTFQAVPFFITNYVHSTLGRFYYPNYGDSLLVYLFSIPLLVLFEIFLMLSILETAKYHLKKTKSAIGGIAAWIFVASIASFLVVYHLLITSSWYYYSQTGFFLGYDALNLFPLLLDFHYVISTFSPAKWFQLVGILAVSIALGFWVVIFAPQRNFFSFVGRYGRSVLIILLMAGVIVINPLTYVHPIFKGLYRTNSFFFLSPQWSLVWAYFRYGRFEPPLPQIPLVLVERKDRDFKSDGKTSKKNVFLFVIEGLRNDIVDKELTPTLHRLAHEGISFANSYSQSSETSESMLSIITGRYPLKARSRTRTLDKDTVHRIYDGIGQAGYLTAYIGEEWSEDTILTDSPFLTYRFDPLTADYSHNDPQDDPFRGAGRGLRDYSLAIADRLKIKRLQNFVDRGIAENKNTFSILYLVSSHFPYDQSDGIPPIHSPNDLNEDFSFLIYPKEIAPLMRNRYLNTIAYVDSMLNSFILFLMERNQLANSVIVVTGDHGEQFWEHDRVGHSRHLDQEAVRVPLIIWGAGDYVRRWGSQVPVGHVDIAPTIYYLLGLPEQLSFQGERILKHKTSADTGATPNRPLFLSIQALVHEDALILWPWKMVRNLWGEGFRIYRLDRDAKESKNLFDPGSPETKMLCSCLVGFRAYQLTYYNPLTKLEKKYYPPRYNTCSDITIDQDTTNSICGLR